MGKRVEVTAGACILWAFLLLVLPLGMLFAAVAAAIFHELCHWLAIRITGGSVLQLRIGAGGMVMETTPMTPGRELICALAGPLGSMTLWLWHPVFPVFAFCGLVQGCFNLLPVYPLDGGRAVGCAVSIVKNTLQSDAFRSTIGKE